MKLGAIDAATVRKAAEIYLRIAYADPDALRRAPRVELDGGASALDLIGRFSDESEITNGRRVGRYVLRLGNDLYPHMKLVLEECILRDEYAFAVDTHDDLRVSADAPDYERWNNVRLHNSRVAQQIEEAWREDHVPTLGDIREMLGAVEQISEKTRSVLVVDDDPSIRETLCTLFERAGMKVSSAANGREALRMVAENRPNLILMDYQMPEMDGVACCEALKSDPDTDEIPVLLATRSQVDLTALTYADGFLVKPYRQDILFRSSASSCHNAGLAPGPGSGPVRPGSRPRCRGPHEVTSAVFDFRKWFRAIFGSRNERVIKGMLPLVAAINALEPEYERMTDAELTDRTAEFRRRLQEGDTLDDLLPEAFAAVPGGQPSGRWACATSTCS